MSEERIFQKLDELSDKTSTIMVGVARLEEQIKDVPDLKIRVNALEKWRWTAMGALGTSGIALASQLYGSLKGA